MKVTAGAASATAGASCAPCSTTGAGAVQVTAGREPIGSIRWRLCPPKVFIVREGVCVWAGEREEEEKGGKRRVVHLDNP